MSIRLESTENLQTYDILFDGKVIGGEITNRTIEGGFRYKTDDYKYELSATELRIIADELDKLNAA